MNRAKFYNCKDRYGIINVCDLLRSGCTVEKSNVVTDNRIKIEETVIQIAIICNISVGPSTLSSMINKMT